MKKFLSFKSVKFLALMLSLVQFVSPPAFAEHHEDDDSDDGWYVSGGVSTVIDRENAFDVTDSPLSNRSGTASLTDDHPGFSLAFGRKRGNFRVEGEVFWVPFAVNDIAYQSIDVLSDMGMTRAHLAAANEGAEVDGTFDVSTATINVYYDFENDTKFVPYVGVGIGVAKSHLNATETLLGTTGHGHGVDYSLATQIRAGIGYRITERARAYAAYRLLHVGTANLPQDVGSTVHIRPSFSSHFEVGIQYTLGGR